MLKMEMNVKDDICIPDVMIFCWSYLMCYCLYINGAKSYTKVHISTY